MLNVKILSFTLGYRVVPLQRVAADCVYDKRERNSVLPAGCSSTLNIKLRVFQMKCLVCPAALCTITGRGANNTLLLHGLKFYEINMPCVCLLHHKTI